MPRRSAVFFVLGLLLFFPSGASVLAAASPEEAGLSSERLARIGQALTRQIDARSFPGAVALVACKGSIVYFEAFGQLDPQTGASMTKDAIFRLYSMTKPFTSVAAMLLVEDGRLHEIGTRAACCAAHQREPL
jgi:CubicO group peptidase (beta-lactamase class C family)